MHQTPSQQQQQLLIQTPHNQVFNTPSNNSNHPHHQSPYNFASHFTSINNTTSSTNNASANGQNPNQLIISSQSGTTSTANNALSVNNYNGSTQNSNSNNHNHNNNNNSFNKFVTNNSVY